MLHGKVKKSKEDRGRKRERRCGEREKQKKERVCLKEYLREVPF